MLTGGSLSAEITLGRGIVNPYGWLYSWNSRSVPNGTYILKSVATDAVGRVVTSKGVSITVANPAT